jgi:hypothetical protein
MTQGVQGATGKRGVASGIPDAAKPNGVSRLARADAEKLRQFGLLACSAAPHGADFKGGIIGICIA